MGDLSGCPTKLENWKFKFEIFGFRYLCCCPTKLEYLKFKFEIFGFRYLCGCPTKLEYVEDIWNIFRRRFDRLEIVFECVNIFEALLRFGVSYFCYLDKKSLCFLPGKEQQRRGSRAGGKLNLFQSWRWNCWCFRSRGYWIMIKGDNWLKIVNPPIHPLNFTDFIRFGTFTVNSPKFVGNKGVKYAIKTVIFKSLGLPDPTLPHLCQLSQILKITAFNGIFDPFVA